MFKKVLVMPHQCVG